MLTKKILLPIKLKKSVLALGAQAKNTLCFAQGRAAYLSGVHENLSSPQDYLNFVQDAKIFLGRKPQIIAYDLHPEYLSTKYVSQLRAIDYGLRTIQHHHAHIAACMAENGIAHKRVIGIAFDGTGLGSDNTLWGAEFLICDYKNFLRAAHLREVPLIGAERAISEPWRVAAAWLYLLYKDKFLGFNLDFSKGINKNSWRILKEIYKKNFNCPLASSMGRMFDAAASLILAKQQANFEAELAIELEQMAACWEVKGLQGYNFKISSRQGIYLLDPAGIFKGIIVDLKNGTAKEKIAYKFHFTIGEMIRKTCLLLKKRYKIDTVALSGGVFQNQLLLRLAKELLLKEKFRLITHLSLPCNDANISLGQAVIAGYRS